MAKGARRLGRGLRPASHGGRFLAAGGVLAVLAALVVVPIAPARADVPAQVTLDGTWEVTRTELAPCTVAVPPVMGGSIHLEADFVAGTITGWIEGEGAGTAVLDAACWNETVPETWYGEIGVIDGAFEGPLDRTTGNFDIEFDFYAEAWGYREAPGISYRCGTEDWTLTCALPEIWPDQAGTLAGTVLGEGTVQGTIDLYTFDGVYCAKNHPDRDPPLLAWGDGCPTAGTWTATVTEVVWRENQAPILGGISATPAEPTSEDTITFTVDATDPDDDELTYAWYVDGERQGVSAPSVTWAKPAPGDHVVRVTVSDGGDSVDAYFDIRVAEHVGAGDADDDGVPDDEDLCPDEFGLADDGCPPFAARLACAPMRPLPDEQVACTATVVGRHVGEELRYDWYLDGASTNSGDRASWVWPIAEDGLHDIGLDVIGEGRNARADLTLRVGGGVVDEATAGFRIVSMGCNSRISSDDTLRCSVSFERDRDDIGPLAVSWKIDGAPAFQGAAPGTSADWSADEPAPGDHVVTATLLDPATNYMLARTAAVTVVPGSNAMVPPLAQAGAAVASTLTAGAWLWLEWARRQREAAAEADTEAALEADRAKWFDRIMARNRNERTLRAKSEAAAAAQQEAAAAQWKRLVDGLDEAIDRGADLDRIRQFVLKRENEVFKDGRWDVELLSGLQDKVQRLGLSQSDRDLYQTNADFLGTVGPVQDAAFHMSRSLTVRIGSAILTGGYSEALWIPISARDAMWHTVTDPAARGRARSAEAAGVAGWKSLAKETGALLLWGKVVKSGASAFAPELEAAGKYLSDDFARWWSVGKVKQAWAALPTGTQAKLAGFADDTWNFFTRPIGSKPQPKLPVIEHGWGKPVTFMNRTQITSWAKARPAGWGTPRLTPFVENLDKLRAAGLEDDVVRFMSHLGSEGTKLTGISSMRYGVSRPLVDPLTGKPTDTFRLDVGLTVDEELALRAMQNPHYRRLLNEGAIPKQLHAAAVHARDKYVKIQVTAACERMSPSLRDRLVRIDFTGTGARPHSPAATSTRFTDLDLTPRGTPDPAGKAAERAFRSELQRGFRGDPTWADGAFNPTTTDVNTFPGLRPSKTPPPGGYGSTELVHWQEVDSAFRARSAIPTKTGVVFDASPSARPMPGQGSIQPPVKVGSTQDLLEALQFSPVRSTGAVADAGRVIGNHINDMQLHLRRPPTQLEVLVAEGKHARRVWWAHNQGTGQPAPDWIRRLDHLKLHPNTPVSPQAQAEMWDGFTRMFGEHADLGGIR